MTADFSPFASQILEMYRQMVLIRAFEGRVRTLATAGEALGLVHLSSGQEAVAVGVCAALRPTDVIASNHRGHGHCLAKGADPTRLIAEILGRVDGYGRGRGGSMHVLDPTTGNLGTNGIVGGGVPLAAGAGLAARAAGTDRVAASFFGDGALNQGLVYEVMNMAAIWSLPVLFICENNGYGEYTASADVTGGPSALARGEAFGVPSEDVDGMDVIAVYTAAARAVVRARAGKGPTFINCATWRFEGHHVGDAQTYKDEAEAALWRARDPIERLAGHIVASAIAAESALTSVRDEAAETIRLAVTAARKSPEPDRSMLEFAVYA
jgi:acetoin:2,6-dichlorophenolindophenol oxidoreductase subunit alpha